MSHNVTIKGFLTEDAAVNTVNAQRDALNFTVASTRRWPDGNGGTNEKTEFFECVMFRARGQFNAILSKGRFVKGTEVKVNRAYMETSKNVVGEKTYNNVQFVVDGFRNANAPSLEILTTKAERDFMKLAKEQGQFVQPAPQAPAQQTPVKQAPVQQAPVEQAPAQQAPVQTKEPAQAMPQYNEPPMDFDDDIPF